MRLRQPESLGTTMLLSAVGLGRLVISGWLGGKLVYEHGVGIETTGVPGRRAQLTR